MHLRIRSYLAAIAAAAISLTTASAQSSAPLTYPAAQKGDQVDVYHGVRVADPYRWLEDTDSPATSAWVKAENQLTFGYLAAIPERARIRSRLETLWNYTRYSAPEKHGGRYFYTENSGLQNQAILYVQDGRDGKARILLDPNSLSKDGTVALTTTSPSPDGRYLGYGVAVGGSDWQEFRVRDVNNGADLADTLKWVKFSSLAWTRDNKGFFYSRYDAPQSGNALTNANQFHKLYYHRLGQAQSRDELIYSRPDQPGWLFEPEVTEDGQYAVITVFQGTDVRNRIYYIDMESGRRPQIGNPVVRLIDRSNAAYTFVGNSGTTFYLMTDYNAPRGRIISINLDFPDASKWQTMITETSDAMEKAQMAGNQILAVYLHDARSVMRLFGAPKDDNRSRRRASQPPAGARADGRGGYDGDTNRMRREPARNGGGTWVENADVALPALGSVDVIQSRQGDDEVFYSFTSFLYPTTIFRYDLKARKSEVFRAPKLDFNSDAYETTQVFYTSKDGTKVPMFIIAKKGIALDGNNPTILYAYGGFNISETPFFSSSLLTWIEMGGVYAVANIRGGGEYGKAWHEGGMLARKQNVFDDFIAGAEYLISQKYTSRKKLAVNGGSNGGLLIGAVMTQRPELFGAALPDVGVMDMLRFQKFTIGAAWASDYGSSDDSTQFTYLRAYSPLHNIKPGTCYPPTLATTADHDDRVVPAHTFKFIATLQAAQGCANPVLVRIGTSAGHGAGKPTSKRIDEAADRFSFLVKTLGIALH
ncbi:MAG: prolyl oligopeptidase family serine peptidase [Gemmatimonadota bacterium]|nr:prolyl oligopeptidase family serine peptidase [Gemmatimonadota bacterium]